MPSKTPAQARLMAAAAHTPGGYGGVPQKVGKEFNSADKGSGILKKKKPKSGNNAPKGDNRKGRLSNIATDRGTFRFKSNRKGE